MKITTFDRAIKHSDFHGDDTHCSYREDIGCIPRDVMREQRRRRVGARRLISQGHVRMFRQLREEGYSWRQIATICGVPFDTAKGAVHAADKGRIYPEVTVTVIECRRSRVGAPQGNSVRGAA